MANYIQNVPKELLTDIVARVASSSIKDYFKLKLSSKLFKEAGEDNFVYKHVSFDEFPVVAWHDYVNETTTSFINRCIDCENPDALYRKGMAQYFALDSVGTAIDYLVKAALLGHNGAVYVYVLFLLGRCLYEDVCGSDFVGLMRKSFERRASFNVYRNHLGELLVSVVTETEISSNKFIYCTPKHDELNESCGACLCDEEIARVFCYYFDSLQIELH